MQVSKFMIFLSLLLSSIVTGTAQAEDNTATTFQETSRTYAEHCDINCQAHYATVGAVASGSRNCRASFATAGGAMGCTLGSTIPCFGSSVAGALLGAFLGGYFGSGICDLYFEPEFVIEEREIFKQERKLFEQRVQAHKDSVASKKSS